MRYFLRLAYNGGSFHGWQRQPNAVSVQQTIEEALAIILREPISITGAGRTDTGVHAREMYAHFDFPSEIKDENKFLVSLNRVIGKNISINKLIPVSDTAHTRFDAISRTYKYFISYEKSPFIYPYSSFSHVFFDIEKMNECAAILTKVNDFTSFAKLHSDVKTNICNVMLAEWRVTENLLGFGTPGIVFTIKADRFLRNMVRAVVGTLVEVGRNKLSTEGFVNIIDVKNRCAAGMSMPAEGLFLWEIEYPYIRE